MQTPYDTARAQIGRAASGWRAIGLRLPPVPSELADLVDSPGEALALTSAEVDPSDLDAFIAAVADPAASPYVSFGQGGYGLNSRALFYQLVTGPVAVFARIPFGNVYADADEERAEALEVIEQIEELVVAVEAAAKSGRLPEGKRFMVIHDPLRGGRLGLFPGKSREEPDALAQALEAFAGDDEA